MAAAAAAAHFQAAARSTPGGKCINWRTGEPLLRTDGRGRREGRQRNTSLKWNIQPDGLWDGSMMESGEEEEETGKDVWGQPRLHNCEASVRANNGD